MFLNEYIYVAKLIAFSPLCLFGVCGYYLLYFQRLVGSCGEPKLNIAAMSRNGGERVVGEDFKNSEESGGVRDLYGEDSATEDQLITPWTFSVAR